jgi:response regulator NasT
LKVLLVDDDAKRATWVEACLEKAGYETSAIVSNHVGLLRQISIMEPQVIVIDMDSPGRDILESLAILSDNKPLPVVMFSAEDDPDYINRAVSAGVTAYMVDQIHEDKVKPIIDVAIAQFRAFQGLRDELKETQTALGDQKTIDRAKILIMEKLKVDEATAHQHLRSNAMQRRLKICEVAEELIKELS